MKAALKYAQKAADIDEVPIGAIVVLKGEIIGVGYNLRQSTNLISRHAEILALEEAAQKLNTWKLNDCELYTTLEPCSMCCGAISQSRIKNVYIAVRGNESKNYLSSRQTLEELTVTFGLCELESKQMLKDFFQKKRDKEKDD